MRLFFALQLLDREYVSDYRPRPAERLNARTVAPKTLEWNSAMPAYVAKNTPSHVTRVNMDSWGMPLDVSQLVQRFGSIFKSVIVMAPQIKIDLEALSARSPKTKGLLAFQYMSSGTAKAGR